ncbi:alpha/beta hydrolase [Streptomyces cinnamoneus]|uniref:Alpha/beta hydrolase n=2 Tax=Streptomyces cinnamoneus TaxID=53446 RepID=A0A2G1XJW5_STRCJ|nr:alpha/beta hydrolase [Streptomyces cinnamoneus]PPT11770.1 alpha/beta hydrolase [Streptomyces cinnamoneus]
MVLLPATTALTAAAAPGPAASVSASSGHGRADRSAPSPRLPEPTGAHAVGRSTLHLVDRDRPDPWVPEAGPRELMVDVYYPARAHTGRQAPYATTEEIRLFLKDRGLTGAVDPGVLSSTRTNSRTDARPEGGRHPLVVLSPGFSVSRYTQTVLAEELASRGYVVATVDHAYESAGTAFPGGRVLTCVACEKAQTPADFRAAARGRAEDISFVVDRLTGPRPAWRYAGLIDDRRIGVAGHSMGGASAASAMARDDRLKAGLNMDGGFRDPVPAGGLDGRPFLLLGTDDATHRPHGTDTTWDEAWQRLDGWKRWLTVSGSVHFSFCDMAWLTGQLGLPLADPPPPLSGSRATDIVRAYAGAFFDQHLRGVPQPLLDGPDPAHPEVRFQDPAAERPRG